MRRPASTPPELPGHTFVRLLGSVPALKPVIPDPGARFQLVHADDVARAFVAGVRGVGEPGPYNLAGGGTLTFSHLASAMGCDGAMVESAGALQDALARRSAERPLVIGAVIDPTQYATQF